ncbi:deoxyribonuclease IV [Paenibacillus tarimensis]|uniref:deoxyribonuclease IV n=1 Tax=Paenibacillus tarimensis TaxID=416012 RepID=UPI001F2E661E|nr:deoxyribonuclease IV [Paenibacillus tarimensis]MCF2942682.1 deoxyribonuclease IV [Paenibacillus tarimensis]
MQVRIGSHVSIKRGFKGAAEEARGLGGLAYQYFPKNPRSLGVKELDRREAERCASYCRENGIASIAHSPYPVNLAFAPGSDHAQRTAVSLLNDLEIAEACGSLGTVVHFGIYKGPDILEGYRHIIASLDRVLKEWTGAAKLLIENQAGDHAPMGTTFDELVQIRSLSRYPEKIGFCLDTCHLFASGVWNETNGECWMEKARELEYFDHLAAIHLNDSRYESGSRRDRHAAIGQGRIGEPNLRWLLAQPEIRSVPLILETPEPEGYTHRKQLLKVSDLLATE